MQISYGIKMHDTSTLRLILITELVYPDQSVHLQSLFGS